MQRVLVNWQGAMILTPQEFVQTENFMIDYINKCNEFKLTNYNYGLLRNCNDIQIMQLATEEIEVVVNSCYAITHSGIIVDFNTSDNTPPLVKRVSLLDKSQNVNLWSVILVVDPYARVPMGEINPEEEPPRYPNAKWNYGVHIIPFEEVSMAQASGNIINLARLCKEGGVFKSDESYIPPSVKVLSHPLLEAYYNKIGKLLTELTYNSKLIISKTYSVINETHLGESIRGICDGIMVYLSGVYFGYKNMGRHFSPIEVIEHIVGVMYTIYSKIEVLKKGDKEELLKYFYEWSDITPSAFESLLTELIELEYNHNNISELLSKGELGLIKVMRLWQNLAKLEFIGEHKESIIVSQWNIVEK